MDGLSAIGPVSKILDFSSRFANEFYNLGIPTIVVGIFVSFALFLISKVIVGDIINLLSKKIVSKLLDEIILIVNRDIRIKAELRLERFKFYTKMALKNVSPNEYHSDLPKKVKSIYLYNDIFSKKFSSRVVSISALILLCIAIYFVPILNDDNLLILCLLLVLVAAVDTIMVAVGIAKQDYGSNYLEIEEVLEFFQSKSRGGEGPPDNYKGLYPDAEHETETSFDGATIGGR